MTTFVKNNVPNTTASKIEIDFPKTVKISGKGLTKCAPRRVLEARRQGQLPRQVEGRHRRLARRRWAPTARRSNFDVNAYVGGKNLVIFYVQQHGGT